MRNYSSLFESNQVDNADEASTPGEIRVLIADDHPQFRLVLEHVIGADPAMTVVAALGDGATALEEIRRLAPDVAVLDVSMPGLDGIEVAGRLVDDQLGTRAVIVTMHSERVIFERAIAAGVSGYVLKDMAFSEVVEAIRAAARGQSYVSPSLSAAFGREK